MMDKMSINLDERDACWEWKASRLNGYGGMWLNGKMVGAHRVSWMIFRGTLPDELHVCHKCDNRICVRPSHLFLGTHQDNMDDKVRKKRQPKGEDNGNSKLTQPQVEEIRRLSSEGISQVKLAKRFSVSRFPIHGILTGKLWRQ